MVTNGNPLTAHLDLWTSALLSKSTAGRGNNGRQEAYGIKKLRELILELAVRGKLVPQDPNDEPASVFSGRIAKKIGRPATEENIGRQKTHHAIDKFDQPFEIPTNWVWSRLGQLCVLENGDRSKNYPNKSCLVEEGIPFINAGHLQDGQIKMAEMNYITARHFELLRSGKVKEGDILYCLRGSLGKAAIVHDIGDGAIASSLVIVRLLAEFVNRYLLIYFKSPLSYESMRKYDNGTAQPNLSATDLAKFLVPIPPLAEQHRIVAKVDELMALCDRLEQQQTNSQEAHQILVETLLGTLTQIPVRAEPVEARPSTSSGRTEFEEAWTRIADHFDILFTTEHSIDQLKQTILQLAVMGKLVPQDPNDEPANAYLTRIARNKQRLIEAKEIQKPAKLPPIDADAMPFQIPTGWQWAYVWSVVKLITSGSRDWARYYTDKGAIFVTMGNLSRGDYKLRLDSLRYVKPPMDGEGSRTRLEPADLLISITGDVGNLGLIPEDFGEAYINQHTCLLRFMPECQSRYFPELMRSPWAKYQFDAPQRGIKNSFRLIDVGEMLIPIPPLAEQHRIVAKVDELMALCDTLKVRLKAAQATQINLADAIVELAVA